MKEQLISFETAKLAKSKGYEGKVGLGYRHNTGNYYNGDGELNGDCIKYIKAIIKSVVDSKDYPVSPNISAPTQSLLQKWVREVYYTDISVNKDSSDIYHCMVSSNLHIRGPFFSQNYEESLEKGLQAALKLIIN